MKHPWTLLLVGGVLGLALVGFVGADVSSNGGVIARTFAATTLSDAELQNRLQAEWAGVLTWQNRIARIQVRERDLFGRWASRWRVIRTSNAYVFRDPQQRPVGVPASKSENPESDPPMTDTVTKPKIKDEVRSNGLV